MLILYHGYRNRLRRYSSPCTAFPEYGFIYFNWFAKILLNRFIIVRSCLVTCLNSKKAMVIRRRVSLFKIWRCYLYTKQDISKLIFAYRKSLNSECQWIQLRLKTSLRYQFFLVIYLRLASIHPK